MLSGDNGILKQAENAKIKTEDSNEQETLELLAQGVAINNHAEKIEKGEYEDFGYKVSKTGDKYIATNDKIGAVIDGNGKILAKASVDIVNDINEIKKEYLSKENEIGDQSLSMSFGSTDYAENDESLGAILNTYKPDKYKMTLKKGYLMCVYAPDIMTKEEINVCQSMDIYYWGDGNGDNVIDYWDQDCLNNNLGKTEGKEVILLDLDGNGKINNNDRSIWNSRASSIIVINQEQKNNMSMVYREYNKTLKDNNMKEDNSYLEINAKTEEELKQYIPSYSDSLDLPYKLFIQRGVLYWEYDKTKLYPKSYMGNTIYILGDADGNFKIDNEDIKLVEECLNSGEGYYYEEIDMNNDGVTNEKDIEMIKSMI